MAAEHVPRSIYEEVETYSNEIVDLWGNIDERDVALAAYEIIKAFRNGKRVFMVGNGGTAGILSNFATDLNQHPFVSEDKAHPAAIRGTFEAVNLSESPSTLTACANDLGWSAVYSSQICQSGKEGDVLVAVSGSGNSPNIVAAGEAAHAKKMTIIGISRNENGIMKDQCHHFILAAIPGEQSKFPGQTGKNNWNFMFEDFCCSFGHVVTGVLKSYISSRDHK